MSDVIVARSPLENFRGISTPVRGKHEPGLIMEERRNILQFQLIARNNMSSQLSALVTQFLGAERMLLPMEGARHRGLFICATGPREYWILARKPDAIDALTQLQNMVEQAASVFDQGEGWFVIELTGRNALDVLAKRTALDMQASGFPTQGATHTVIEHIPTLLVWRRDPARYNLCVPRSYARSFMTWLCEASAEYGYEIEK
ncbi:MAG: hypothetical protein GY927_09295 [bacterium]|nr:hypothetical protein [bacterium]